MSTQLDARNTDDVQGSFFPSVERMDQLADELNGKKFTRANLRSIRRTGERGRPPGATNKRQETTAKWFLQQYGSPLAVMGEIMNMPADVLMDLLEGLQGGDAKHKPLRAIDAIKLKLEAADKAAPYIHGKMPTEIQVSAKADMVISIPGLKSLAEAAAMLPQDDNGQEIIDAIAGADIQMLPSHDPADGIDT